MMSLAFLSALPIGKSGISRIAASCPTSAITICARQPVTTRRAAIFALASPTTVPKPSTVSATQGSTSSDAAIFQCPTCGMQYPPVAALELSSLPSECSNCSTKIVQRSGYVDMTGESTMPLPTLGRIFSRANRRSSVFQLPSVSYAYERGWRDSFARAGFPGIDREFDMFIDFVGQCENVLDLSCGSGLMARRLAVADEIKRVIASDYSDAMMRETVQQARRDPKRPKFDVVKADVNSLPFVDGAFDAVHAGAALHAWPNVQDGLAEVKRVLKPGGKFFATTFFRLAYFAQRDWLVARPRLMKAALRVEDLIPDKPFRFFEKDELEYLCKAVGFVNVDIEEIRGCAIVRCQCPDSQ